MAGLPMRIIHEPVFGGLLFRTKIWVHTETARAIVGVGYGRTEEKAAARARRDRMAKVSRALAMGADILYELPPAPKGPSPTQWGEDRG